MSKTTEKKKLSLAAKTFIGFALGIVIGLIFKEKASIIKPVGTIFLNMIKMVVVPMVFFSITAGVANLQAAQHRRQDCRHLRHYFRHLRRHWSYHGIHHPARQGL